MVCSSASSCVCVCVIDEREGSAAHASARPRQHICGCRCHTALSRASRTCRVSSSSMPPSPSRPPLPPLCQFFWDDNSDGTCRSIDHPFRHGAAYLQSTRAHLPLLLLLLHVHASSFLLLFHGVVGHGRWLLACCSRAGYLRGSATDPKPCLCTL